MGNTSNCPSSPSSAFQFLTLRLLSIRPIPQWSETNTSETQRPMEKMEEKSGVCATSVPLAALPGKIGFYLHRYDIGIGRGFAAIQGRLAAWKKKRKRIRMPPT